MHVKAGMASEPSLDFGMFVGCVVIQDASSAPYSSSVVIGRKLRTRRIDASASHSYRTGTGIDPPCICLFIGVARASGWIGSARGRGRSDDRRDTRNVLEWVGHGDDRRHRMDIWSSCVISTDGKLPIKNGRVLASTW